MIRACVVAVALITGFARPGLDPPRHGFNNDYSGSTSDNFGQVTATVTVSPWAG